MLSRATMFYSDSTHPHLLYSHFAILTAYPAGTAFADLRGPNGAIDLPDALQRQVEDLTDTLINIITLGDEYTERVALRRIGAGLNQIGGLPAMQRAYELVQLAKPDSAYGAKLNRDWNGIGDWRS